MMLAFALGWVLGIGAAIALLQMAAAAIEHPTPNRSDRRHLEDLRWRGCQPLQRRRPKVS